MERREMYVEFCLPLLVSSERRRRLLKAGSAVGDVLVGDGLVSSIHHSSGSNVVVGRAGCGDGNMIILVQPLESRLLPVTATTC